jgi:MFS family permease
MRRRGVWTTNLVGLLVGFGMFGSFILIPQFVQAPANAGYGFHANVTEAGLFMLPSTFVMLVAGPLSGLLGTRFGSRIPLLLGTLTAASSFGFLALAHDEHWHVYVGTALMGAGIGLAFAAMANLIVEAVDQTETGVATGMNTIMRSIGGALGAQIAASIVGAHADESHFVAAFLVSAAGLALAFLAALVIPRPPTRHVIPHGARRLGEPAATASGSS